MTTTAPDWATDMIVTELRRAYPAEVEKGKLEEATGLGPGELRAAIAALEEEGVLRSGDTGYRYLEVDERSIGPSPYEEGAEAASPDADPDGSSATETGVGSPEDRPEAAQPGSGEVGDTRYAATYVLEVSYHPELLEGEAEDAAAVREAKDLQDIAADGILDAHPSLMVSVKLAGVEAYDSPRRVL